MVYDKNYYQEIWKKILGKYKTYSPVNDLGDLSRQYYLEILLKCCLNRLKTRDTIKIIDLGCGNWLYLGTILDALGDYNKNNRMIPIEIIGIDYSMQAMKFGFEKYKSHIPQNVKITMLEGEISSILDQFEDDEIDVVLSLETLEHLYDDRNVLRKIRKIVKTNARIIVSVPNDTPFFLSKNWFVYKFMKNKFSEKDKKVGHLRRYSLKSLVRLLREFGFSTVKAYCYGFLLSDYLKKFESISDNQKIQSFICAQCKKFLFFENKLCNRLDITSSEGIFVYAKVVK